MFLRFTKKFSRPKIGFVLALLMLFAPAFIATTVESAEENNAKATPTPKKKATPTPKKTTQAKTKPTPTETVKPIMTAHNGIEAGMLGIRNEAARAGRWSSAWNNGTPWLRSPPALCW